MAGVLAEDPDQARLLSVLELERRWVELVGEVAAGRCWPAGFRKGCLTVAADSPTWAQELDFLKADLLARITALLGPGLVTELKFKTGRPKGRRPGPARPARIAPPPPPPPSPELRARLEAELARLKDPELRATLLRLRLKAGR
jgi:predicted nucleic acid-binding Zn ribbon protein